MSKVIKSSILRIYFHEQRRKRIFNKEFNLPAETFGLYTQMWSVLTLFHKGEEVTDNSSFNQKDIVFEVMNCIK